MANLSKIGTSLLEMEDISNYLHLKDQFLLKGENATDVDNVSNIAAQNIAKAYTIGNEAARDRETIRNAVNLNGHPESYFLSAEKGAEIVNNAMEMKKTYSDEIKDIRDELYQLRAELARKGEVAAFAPYAGFYDLFRSGMPVHEAAVIATATKTSSDQYTMSIPDYLYDKFAVNDKVLLVDRDGGKPSIVVTIDKIMPDHSTLHFSKASGFDIIKDSTEIYKSYGTLLNGTFTFGISASRYPGAKELVTTVDDDTHLVSYPMQDATGDVHCGIGYSFRIPANFQNNYLSKIEVMGKQYGNPGAMKCYIIDERNISHWKNPTQAAKDGFIVAESQPVLAEPWDKPTDRIKMPAHFITFNFYDPATREFPFLDATDSTDHKIRYVMIIDIASAKLNYLDEAKNSVDYKDSDTYEIFYVQGKDSGDLEVNNNVYVYNQKVDNSIVDALTPMPFVADLYYSATLIEARTGKFVPYDEGLYSARFSTADPIKVSKARLTMRIAREGLFTINKYSAADMDPNFSGQPSVTVAGEQYVDDNGSAQYDKDGFTLSNNKNIIIGTNVCKVTAVNDDTLHIDKAANINVNDIVYPINYTATLLAKNKTWDATKNTIVTTGDKKFNLKLVGVVPDVSKENSSVSDRLVFEADLVNDTGDTEFLYNDFELQLSWEKSSKINNDRLAGRIYDLSVSLSRAIS